MFIKLYTKQNHSHTRAPIDEFYGNYMKDLSSSITGCEAPRPEAKQGLSEYNE